MQKMKKDSEKNGVEIAETFYFECVLSHLSKKYDWFEKNHSSCLIGYGFDDSMSRDHDFGPRVIIFVASERKNLISQMKVYLSENLPERSSSLTTHFYGHSDGCGYTLTDKEKTEEKIPEKKNHRVQIFTLEQYLEYYIGIEHLPMSDVDWLSIPQQKLLGLTSGKVFFDGLDVLEKVRKYLSYYPEKIWMYIMHTQWQKICEEEAFVGRTGIVGDELGSKIVGSKISCYLMEICFMYEKKYIPYSKWLGSGFKSLQCHVEMNEILTKVLLSTNWKEREKQLLRAYDFLAKIHNKLFNLKEKEQIESSQQFHSSCGDKICEHLERELEKHKLKIKFRVGNFDQVYHAHTCVLEDKVHVKKFFRMFDK